MPDAVRAITAIEGQHGRQSGDGRFVRGVIFHQLQLRAGPGRTRMIRTEIEK